MIVRLTGRLAEKTDEALILELDGVHYEVLAPSSVRERIDEATDPQGRVSLVVYHYIQVGPASSVPVLVGFLNTVERDFFQQFIKVSGIGPRAAVRALARPISEIARAIDGGDEAFLKRLPGIGPRKAKEIVAKLQGRIGRYGLIRDERARSVPPTRGREPWREEALAVLMQLQYTRAEAQDMIREALERRGDIRSAEALLNAIYQQRRGDA